jgi:protein-disulfide isomerase
VYLPTIFHLSSDLSADGVEMSSKQRASKSYLPFIIIVVVLLVAIGGGTLLFRASKRSVAPTQKATSSGLAGAKPPHVKGSENAPVTLEEFGDFECPPCGIFYPELKKLEADYSGDKLRIIFRQFPLPQVHKYALIAAYAAEAAGFQGRFWEMYDKLYSDQATWSKAPDPRPFLLDYARQIGLDVNRFVQDINSSEAQARVTLDQQRGHSLGVKGTPTIFINGRMLPPETTDKMLRDMIDEGLKSGGK